MSDDRPRPASFGFDADFSDLSNVQPATRTGIIKGAGSKPASAKAASTNTAKDKAANPKPSKTKPAKTSRPKLAKEPASHKADIPAVLKERAKMADKLAKSMGFESREQKPLVLKKRRRTHHDEPVDPVSYTHLTLPTIYSV